MAKVLGVGGVFFKAHNPEKLGAWYAKWLGITIDPSYGGCGFDPATMPQNSYTVWSPFKADTDYFQPSPNPYMINLIVDDLYEALDQVQEGGATLAGAPEEIEFGKFGWFIDPEGNKIELWQPA